MSGGADLNTTNGRGETAIMVATRPHPPAVCGPLSIFFLSVRILLFVWVLVDDRNIPMAPLGSSRVVQCRALGTFAAVFPMNQALFSYEPGATSAPSFGARIRRWRAALGTRTSCSSSCTAPATLRAAGLRGVSSGETSWPPLEKIHAVFLEKVSFSFGGQPRAVAM